MPSTRSKTFCALFDIIVDNITGLFVLLHRHSHASVDFPFGLILHLFAVKGETGRPLDDRLSDLVKVWYDLHGCTLKDGEQRLARCQALTKRLGDPLAFGLGALSATPNDRSEARNGQP